MEKMEKMERDVALRQWCLDKAIALLGHCRNTKEVLQCARDYEVYVTKTPSKGK